MYRCILNAINIIEPLKHKYYKADNGCQCQITTFILYFTDILEGRYYIMYAL